jgi:hypothetical protein
MGKKCIKNATKKKVAKNKCVCCKENNATLQMNDYEWICKDCAQNANDTAMDK